MIQELEEQPKSIDLNLRPFEFTLCEDGPPLEFLKNNKDKAIIILIINKRNTKEQFAQIQLKYSIEGKCRKNLNWMKFQTREK